MFFIGATGHFLTLILTICLPFVFIISGHQKITLPDHSLQLEAKQIRHEISTNYVTSGSIAEVSAFVNNCCILIAKSSTFRKIPYRNVNLKKKPFYFDCNENKAPPVFHCFC